MRIWNILAAAAAVFLLPADTAKARDFQAGPAQILSPSEQDHAFARDFGQFLGGAMARFPSVPAISVAIVHDGVPVFVGVRGLADVERGLAASKATRFYIASSTKSFVGTAMALLDARGTIDLDWTVADLAPDLQFDPRVRADQVTLRHLLSHAHGLSSEALTFRLAYSGDHDTATLWRLLAELTPDAEAPLGKFDYGNLGYNIATMLVERRIGRRWQDIVESELLHPLGMAETMTQGVDARRAALPFAEPHDGSRRLYLVKADATMQSAGGMYSTAGDLARWLQLQLSNAGALGGAAAAARQPVVALEESFGPFRRTGYGLGWYSGPYDSTTLYHAFGSFTGARAHVSVMPARGLGVAVATNDEGVGFRFVDVIAVYAYDWYLHGAERAAAHAAEMLGTLEQQWVRHRERVATARADRAQRAWTLSMPNAAYTGRYCNAGFGVISVEERAAGLGFTMGRLSTVAEAGSGAEVVRLEFIPNKGEEFKFESDGRVAIAIVGPDSRFERCN